MQDPGTRLNFIIGRTAGRPILADLHFAGPEAPLVIFCHGFKGFKDWGSYPDVAAYFSENGVSMLRFNFSHNGGTVDQPIDFPDLEAFGSNTFSKELADLAQVRSYVEEQLPTAGGIHLLAHSRGAATAIMSAAGSPNIASITTWAGVSTIGERLERMDVEMWEKEGVTYSTNGRTAQEMPLYYSLYADYLEHRNEYDLLARCGELRCPHLVIGAKDDAVVPPAEAEALADSSPQSVLHLLESGGHTFGAKHPAAGHLLPAPLKEACEFTVAHVKRYRTRG